MKPVHLYTRIKLLCKWMKDGDTQVLTVEVGDKQRGKGLEWNMCIRVGGMRVKLCLDNYRRHHRNGGVFYTIFPLENIN